MNRQVSIKQVQVANVDNTENTMMVDSGVTEISIARRSASFSFFRLLTISIRASIDALMDSKSQWEKSDT